MQELHFFLELHLTGTSAPIILNFQGKSTSKQMSLPTMSPALLTQLVVSAPRSILGSDIPKSSRPRTGCPSVSNLYVTQVSCKI